MQNLMKIYFKWALVFVGLALLAEKLSASAILPPPGRPSIGGSVIGGTDGSVLFVNPTGALNEDNPNFIYESGKLSTPNLRISDLTTGVCKADVDGDISSSLIVNADVDAAAAIARSKLASGDGHRVLINDGSGVMSETSALLNGELVIGSTGDAPVVSTLTGTANRVSVTNGAGSITLSSPQDIHTGASPEFTGLTLSGLTDGVVKSTSGVLSGGNDVDLESEVEGTLPVGNGGTGVTSLSDILGTANQVAVASGTARVIGGDVTLSLPQDIHSGASPQFTGLTISGVTDGLLRATSGAVSGGNDVDLEAEVEGVLPMANGGTAKALSAVEGGIVYTDNDSMEILAAGSVGQILQSNGAAAPSWYSLHHVESVTTTSVTGTSARQQSFRYTGGSAQTLGSIDLTAVPDGARITFVGTSNINTYEITSGTTGVHRINGSITLHDGSLIEFEHISGSGLVEVSRNDI